MHGDATTDDGPLSGVRVLELGSFIAGPFAGQLLGDYGADVIKIESPGAGDTMRAWGVTKDGESLWWPTIGRNKRSVVLDLRLEAARTILLRLVASSDIVVENFRPGRMEEWGLGYDVLAAANEQIVVVHVSGFGQTGPRSHQAGFGSIGEAMGGIRHTTGYPDQPSTRTGVSLGDSLAAMFAVIGAVAAWSHAQRTGRGQEVDVAIYEAVAAIMESTLADFELGGVTRTRSGSVLPGVAPSNVYPTSDDSEVVIAANADTVFERLCAAMGKAELAIDPRFASHVARGKNMIELDEVIAAWTGTVTASDLLELLEQYAVPAGLIFAAPDMLRDAHYLARDMIVRRTSAQGWDVPMTGIVPRFMSSPGTVRFPGAPLGAHSREVLLEVAGLDEDEFRSAIASGVVSAGPQDDG